MNIYHIAIIYQDQPMRREIVHAKSSKGAISKALTSCGMREDILGIRIVQTEALKTH